MDIADELLKQVRDRSHRSPACLKEKERVAIPYGLANDDMIDKTQLEDLGGFVESSGEADVGLGRPRITGYAASGVMQSGYPKLVTSLPRHQTQNYLQDQ